MVLPGVQSVLANTTGVLSMSWCLDFAGGRGRESQMLKCPEVIWKCSSPPPGQYVCPYYTRNGSHSALIVA
eukprot:scaffold219519_cov15-Tisochrysis_lutea.AAC.1